MPKEGQIWKGGDLIGEGVVEAHQRAENFAGLAGPQLVHSHWARKVRSPQRPKGAEAVGWGNWGTFAGVRPRLYGMYLS